MSEKVYTENRIRNLRGEREVHFATEAPLLHWCVDFFETNTDKYESTTFWLPSLDCAKLGGVQIKIDLARVLQSKDGWKISLNPIHAVSGPNPKRLTILQASAKILGAPKCRNTKKQTNDQKGLDLPPAEYMEGDLGQKYDVI